MQNFFNEFNNIYSTFHLLDTEIDSGHEWTVNSFCSFTTLQAIKHLSKWLVIHKKEPCYFIWNCTCSGNLSIWVNLERAFRVATLIAYHSSFSRQLSISIGFSWRHNCTLSCIVATWEALQAPNYLFIVLPGKLACENSLTFQLYITFDTWNCVTNVHIIA